MISTNRRRKPNGGWAGLGRTGAVEGVISMARCARLLFHEVTGGVYMSGWTRGSLFAALKAAGVASIVCWVLCWVPGPRWRGRDPAVRGVGGAPAGGRAPPPFPGPAPSGPRRFSPPNGATAGVAQPIIINFPGLVEDPGAAKSAVHVSPVPPVPGKFYWMTPT